MPVRQVEARGRAEAVKTMQSAEGSEAPGLPPDSCRVTEVLFCFFSAGILLPMRFDQAPASRPALPKDMDRIS